MANGSNSRAAVAAAWAVHLYTAATAVVALLALQAFIDGDPRKGFLWLWAAVAIDSTDGALARWVRVKERTPRFDGTLLDNLADYLTFVFVPAWVVSLDAVVPSGWGLPLGVGMLLASAYGFSHKDAKTSDHFFRGFPSYWNIVAFYLYTLGMMPTVNGVIVGGLVVLVFAPVGFVYPSRTSTLRGVTLVGGTIWAVAMLVAAWEFDGGPSAVARWSMIFPAYYVGVSVVLDRKRRKAIQSSLSP
tara:strand:- start:1008 stop:1742 length:735 start_codon:yes stop_codon:yes gene_type:complete